MPTRTALALLSLLALSAAGAADPEPANISAADLASRLSAKQQDGTSLIRLKLDGGAAKSTLQLQIKSRATRGNTELLYQVLWPKERKGEALLLRKAPGRAATAMQAIPPAAPHSVPLSTPLFGSDLACEDVIENFFAWDQQALVGTEAVDRVNCQILESKPGKGDHSAYSSVRTWVDTRRMVPLRIEKNSGGHVARRIETTKVANDDQGHPIPANLTVRGPGGSSSDLDGSRIRHGVAFTDADFTPEHMGDVAPPHAGAE